MSGRPPKLCRFCGDYCGKKSTSARGCFKRKRDGHMRRAYGLSIEEADALIAKGCALCGREARHIDHDHATGHVRGGLCIPHNRALGILGDCEKSISRVLAYVRGELSEL